jgi:ribonucleoside-diphosphate reductase alpha chain
MKTAIKLEPMDVNSIPFQEASLDIWDKKYRLSAKDGTPLDRSMDDTYKRVARALADVEREDVREHWNEQFLWALRKGGDRETQPIVSGGEAYARVTKPSRKRCD